MNKIYYKLSNLFRWLFIATRHLYVKTSPEIDWFEDDVTSEAIAMDNNEQVTLSLEPVWSELQALEYILDNKQTTPEQRKEFLDELDSLHEALLHAAENVEQIADRLHKSLYPF